jgi:hypothetical protein
LNQPAPLQKTSSSGTKIILHLSLFTYPLSKYFQLKNLINQSHSTLKTLLFSSPIPLLLQPFCAPFSKSFSPTNPLTHLPTTWLGVSESGEKIDEDDFSVGEKDLENNDFSSAT